MENSKLIETFYESFQKRDFKGMNQCYHREVLFYDPVFGQMNYQEVCAMWHMLTQGAKKFELTYRMVEADSHFGSVEWHAEYTYKGIMGRINFVQNQVKAKFEFKDNLIYRHTDEFDFEKWIQMALNPWGKFFCKNTFFQSQIQKKARMKLKAFIQDHREYH